MTTFQELRQYIEDLDVGLALRLDDFGARLEAIENDVATVKLLLGERLFFDPEFVAERLGLTRAQSRLAVALAEGDTVHDIAEATGRTKSTVRWHLREIHRTLGVSMQAQLVRRVLLPPGRARCIRLSIVVPEIIPDLGPDYLRL